MMLVSRNLIIDTQYFVDKALDFENNEFQSLAELVKNGYASVFLTDITEREISKKIKDEISSAYARIQSSDVRYLRKIPLFRKFLNTYDEQKAIFYFEEKFEVFKKNCNVEIISSENITPLSVFEDYCNERPPFNNSKNKKYEFPDAFALAAILQWSGREAKGAYLLSNDKDWVLYAKQSRKRGGFSGEQLFIEISELYVFINLVYRTEDILKNVAAFADSLIEKKKLEIEDRIVRAIKLTAFESDSDEETEIYESNILSAEMQNKDIVTAHRDGAIYSIEFLLTAIFSYDYLDYENSAYDPEDKVYFGTEWKVMHKKQSFIETFEIEISFEGGLETNFNLITPEIPHLITIPFEEGEFIDLKEWALTLPVVVCGVNDGAFTDDGFCAMEFENFNAAKEVFPSLEIYKPTKDFTQALGNRITESLRFETWKANEVYSS